MHTALKMEIDRVRRMLDDARVPPAPERFAGERWTPRDNSLAARIDHTQLRPETTRADVERLCDEARMHGFAAVCVAPAHVATCAERLLGSAVRIVSVVGFPHGDHATATKVFEAAHAAGEGAHELDAVVHVGALKGGAFHDVWRDLAAIAAAAPGRLVKVILECALLEEHEKIAGCLLAERAGAHFVKTSTGFARGGATVDDVQLLRTVVGSRLGVKAAGGIRTRSDAESMLTAGADRLGCSASVAIVTAGVSVR